MTAEAERISRLESRVDQVSADTNELKGSYAHLATKADIEAAKSWLLWRIIVGVAIVQGLAAAWLKYLP